MMRLPEQLRQERHISMQSLSANDSKPAQILPVRLVLTAARARWIIGAIGCRSDRPSKGI